MKKILHIDLNAFFAQAEVLQDPSLKGKPVVVGYDGRRGVVSTCSYEARKYGVHSAMPIAKAKELCPEVIIVGSNFHLYHKLSQAFFSYLKTIFTTIEQASIDECYIDASEELSDDNIYEQLFDLQMNIYKNTKLKCSIGFSDNKFLAKMASDMKKPLGITILDRNNIKEKLWPLSIDKMYGVGSKTAPKLIELGINTIGDLATCVDERVKNLLGSYFEYLKSEANGYGSSFVDTSSFNPKSISAERTFAEDENDYEIIKEMIKKCCFEVSKELSKYKKYALSVSIKLRYNDFTTRSKRLSLIKPINDVDSIYNAAMNIFDEFYHNEYIRLVGVGLERVIDESELDDVKVENTSLSMFGEDNDN